MRAYLNLLKTAATSLMLLAGFTAFSQSFTGYYVNLSGDTIHGTFKGYNGWSLSPDKVRFKAVKNSMETILTPSSCLYFQIDNQYAFKAYSGERRLNLNPSQNNSAHITSFVKEIFKAGDFR